MEENNETRIERLRRDCISLASAMIPVCIDKRFYDFPGGHAYSGSSRGFNELDEETKSTINDIIDYATTKVFELDKKITKESDENEIFVEDMVILSIDDGAPIFYYVTLFDLDSLDYIESKDKYIIALDAFNRTIDKDMILHINDSENPLGRELIGKHVGDEFTYVKGENAKNMHNIKILAHRRSKHSYKASRYEIEAEIESAKNKR